MNKYAQKAPEWHQKFELNMYGRKLLKVIP
jgi:hypothetical protein